MSVVSLASLIIQETKEAIYTTALGIASAIGLPVTTWQAGDPTRSLYHLESELLAKLEEIVAGYIRSGFREYAEGDWLKVNAKQVYNVDVPAATFATTDVVLTNGGGGYYPDIEAGDLTFKSSTSDVTYTNTTGGTLASGVGKTLTVTVVADVAGSAGSAGAGDIDEMVTQLLGVTCANPLAAVGIDEQDESVTKQDCLDKLGPLSPDGPREAYSYVARHEEFGGTPAITRTRVYGSDTGDVTVYLAGPSGAVSEADRAIGEAAILKWATPLCVTPTVLSASGVTVPVTYELWIYKSCGKTAAQVATAVATELGKMFAARPIGGDTIVDGGTGKLYQSMIASTIRGTFAQAFRVAVSAPTGDTTLTAGQVAALGTVTPTVNIVPDP